MNLKDKNHLFIYSFKLIAMNSFPKIRKNTSNKTKKVLFVKIIQCLIIIFIIIRYQ